MALGRQGLSVRLQGKVLYVGNVFGSEYVRVQEGHGEIHTFSVVGCWVDGCAWLWLIRLMPPPLEAERRFRSQLAVR